MVGSARFIHLAAPWIESPTRVGNASLSDCADPPALPTTSGTPSRLVALFRLHALRFISLLDTSPCPLPLSRD